MAADPVKEPLVSVCIPAHNLERYIEATLVSLFSQTYPNLEFIVVDDGSTDSTPDILSRLKKDERLRIYRQDKSGASSARNNAYAHAKGEFIKFMDGDDLVNPGMIASQVRLALENPGCVVSSRWGRFYRDDLSTFRESPEECWRDMLPAPWLISSWKNGKSMTQAGLFLIPRSVIRQSGLWDEKLSLIDDLDFFTRVILQSEGVRFDREALLYYRSGIGGLSARRSEEAMRSAFRSIHQATSNLLAAETGREARQACANVWQIFVYNLYPQYPHITEQAMKKIADLGGADVAFACGGYTKLLVRTLGWKAVKRLKSFLKV